MTTNAARGTPAIPLDVTNKTRSIVTCCASVSSIWYAWAMNSTANVQYIIEPARLNE